MSSEVFQLWNQQNIDQARVKNTAGRVKLDNNQRASELKLLQYQLECYERLVCMATVARDSNSYRTRQANFSTDVFFILFGAQAYDDWRKQGELVYRNHLVQPGMFVKHLSSVEASRNAYKGKVNSLLKRTERGGCTSAFRQWYVARQKNYDPFGRRLLPSGVAALTGLSPV